MIDHLQIGKNPANTLRNDNVVITSKRRHFDVITSKWRRFDVITTLVLRHVFRGKRRSYQHNQAVYIIVSKLVYMYVVRSALITRYPYESSLRL